MLSLLLDEISNPNFKNFIRKSKKFVKLLNRLKFDKFLNKVDDLI